MEFAEFVDRATVIEEESADIETVELVASLFVAAGDDLEAVSRFIQGRIFPAHDETKLDVGPALCYEALAKAAGRNVTVEDIEAKLAEAGEIGTVAQQLELGGQRGLSAFAGGDEDPCSVGEVEAILRSIAVASGSGSTDTKLDMLFGLFNRAEPLEARYLTRLVLGEMRVGVGEGTVRDGIAEAFDVSVETVERALHVSNDCGVVARTARDEGEVGLADIRLRVGRPVQSMLAQTGTALDAVEAWEDVAVETKFDGVRIQIHYDGDTAALFSRNMERVTNSLPEVTARIEEAIDVPAIVDGEVVAVEPDGTPLPFQHLLRRFRRKHDVAAAREETAVELYAFDCLHADGEDLLDSSFRHRHTRLRELLPASTASVTVSDDIDEIAELEADALVAGHEGIMLKNPNSTYIPGNRGKTGSSESRTSSHSIWWLPALSGVKEGVRTFWGRSRSRSDPKVDTSRSERSPRESLTMNLKRSTNGSNRTFDRRPERRLTSNRRSSSKSATRRFSARRPTCRAMPSDFRGS